MNVCVVGIGRMGLAVAVQLASAGATVVGADVDRVLVDGLNRDELDTAAEPGLRDRLTEVRAAGRLRATSDTTKAVAESNAVVVLVRLTGGPGGLPDYESIDAATRSIAAGLRPGTIVSFETTLPVGDTRAHFAPLLEAGSGLVPGRDFHLCFSPERVSSGSIFRDLATYPKLVGGFTTACTQAGCRFYSDHLDAEVWAMESLEAAEFAKVAETTYRDVNIALANEFARFADQVGVTMSSVVRAANSQPYSHIHSPGIGVGGHCIPVYPYFFIARAADSRLVSLARAINEEMPGYGADRLSTLLGGLAGRRVLVLGLAFRGDVPEASHSVTVPLVAVLEERGAEVRVHDTLLSIDEVTRRGLAWGELRDGWADALVLQAAHSEYRRLRPDEVPAVRAVLDGRGFLDPGPWESAGVAFAGIGR